MHRFAASPSAPPHDSTGTIETASRMAALVCLLVALGAPLAEAQAPGVLVRHDNWMGQLFNEKPAAMDQMLSRFIFPGSHDAGAYDLTGVVACDGCYAEVPTKVDEICRVLAWVPAALNFVCQTMVIPQVAVFAKRWGDAQHLSIAGQLNAGARYLDLRFFRATEFDQSRTGGALQAGRFYAYHGLTGPDSALVLNDVASFLAAPGHEREVLILEVSGLREGDGAMPWSSIQLLFEQFRAFLGDDMAPRKDPACAGDPECAATARLGGAASIRNLVDGGHQVIVACDCEDFGAPDVWTTFASRSFYSSNEHGEGYEGYPAPDNPSNPWISDGDIFRALDRFSAGRDDEPSDELFTLGVQIGLDDSAKALVRSIVCGALDPDNVFGMCPAVNADWDRFLGLGDLAAYTNPKALAALVALRRDRINIVSGDHYTTAFTDEVFKLNRGATRVELAIQSVTELSAHDATSGPDYYPVFFYPGVTPLGWEFRQERNIQVPNDATMTRVWPAWKAYPNDWGTASIGFGIFDADSGSAGDDDQSNINFFPFESTRVKFSAVPITGCVQDASDCADQSILHYTRGFGDRSSEVYYRIGACVWSWLPGDTVDADALCTGPLPLVNVQDATREEDDSGSVGLDFVVTLSAPSLIPVSVHYRTGDGSAVAGTDYTNVPDTLLTFDPGETSKTVTVMVRGDAVVEPDETFRLIVDSAAGATVEDGTGLGTILNDDLSSLAIGNATRVEGHGGTSALTFAVTLNGINSNPVTVRYRTSDGTATAGVDYLAVPETLLTFAGGETSRTVVVLVNGDRTVEGQETFFVTLEGATNASIETPVGVGTIVNDDTGVPVLGSLVLTDELGTPLGDTVFALTGFRIDLEAGITEVGLLHLQQALVIWGDGASGTASITDDEGSGLVRGHHAWKTPGRYTVRLSIADERGAVDSRELTVNVAGGLDVVCSAHRPIVTLMNDSSLDAQTRQDLIRLLGTLRGKLSGTTPTGACDLFFRGDLVGGVTRLLDVVAAIRALVDDEQALNASQIDVLHKVETQVVLSAKWTYLKLASRTSERARRIAAAALARDADTAVAAHMYEAAVTLWSEAARLLTAPR